MRRGRRGVESRWGLNGARWWFGVWREWMFYLALRTVIDTG